jgi:peptide/nickel transport system permease protein
VSSFIIRRLIGAILLLFVTSGVTYGIFYIVPQWAGQTTDQLAAQYVGRNPSPEEIKATKERLHLDDPVAVQYGRFVKGLVAGANYDSGTQKVFCPPPCFGYSFRNSEPVWGEMVDRLPVTASLGLGAAVIWLVSGVAIGVLSALRRRTFFDRTAMIIALAGVSLPIYFTGLLSQALFVHSWKLFGPDYAVSYVPLLQNPFKWAEGLILPWITLAFLYAALYARLTRAGMLDTLSEDYIRTARAKGLPERRVITKHALRATLTPILTIFGLDLGLLLGGAVLTEKTFSLQGLGRYAIDAIENNDLPALLGVTLFAALFIVLANLIVDVLYAVVDPRVRHS